MDPGTEEYVTAEQVAQELAAIEQKLAVRLGVTRCVRGHILEGIRSGKLERDELTDEWRQTYAFFLTLLDLEGEDTK